MIVHLATKAESRAGILSSRIEEKILGFSFPVVPKGKARIRTQISAAHTVEDLGFALEQFAAVKKKRGL